MAESRYRIRHASLMRLSKFLQARVPYLNRHSRRVACIAVRFGQELGLSQAELDSLCLASHLHDIGKVWIAAAILNKPGKLNRNEKAVIQIHPLLGEKIVARWGLPPRARSIIRHHYERWDGYGYPDGLAGDNIPFLARVLALADAFEAMTADRPYRYRLSLPDARREIRAGAGSQFAPDLVHRFVKMWEKKNGSRLFC